MSFLSYLSQIFLKFDSIGPTPSINRNLETRYVTFFGSLLTIASAAISIIGSHQVFLDIVNDENPSITTELVQSNKYFNFSRGIDGFSIQFAYWDYEQKKSITLPVTQIPSIDLIQVSVSELNEFFLTPITDSEGRIVKLINCEERENINREFKNMTYYPNTLCLPNQIQNVTLTKKDDNKRIVGVQLKLSYDFKEKLQALIKKDKNQANPQIMVVIYYCGVLISSKYENNSNIEWKQKILFFDDDKTFYYSLSLETHNLEVENGKFIFKNTKPFHFELIQNIEKVFEFKSNHDIPASIECFSFFFQQSLNYPKTTVTYRTFDEFFGTLGGTFSLCLLFSQIICNLVVDPFYQASRINSIFEFHENDSYTKDDEIDNLVMVFLDQMSKTDSDVDNSGRLNVNSKSINEIRNYKECIKNEIKEESQDKLIIASNSGKIPLVNISQTKENRNNKNPDDIIRKGDVNKLSERQILTENKELNKITQISNTLRNSLSKKKGIFIDCFDVYKLKYFCCKFKLDKLVDNRIFMIDYNLDECVIVKNFIKMMLLKDIILNEDQRYLFRIPSTNLRDGKNDSRCFIRDRIHSLYNKLTWNSYNGDYLGPDDFSKVLEKNIDLSTSTNKGLMEIYIKSQL